jgi:hypothetical protein
MIVIGSIGWPRGLLDLAGLRRSHFTSAIGAPQGFDSSTGMGVRGIVDRQAVTLGKTWSARRSGAKRHG